LDQALDVALVKDPAGSGTGRTVALHGLEAGRLSVGTVDPEHLSEELALVPAFLLGETLEVCR